MKKMIQKTLLSFIATSALLQAGGYKIPETSTNGVALSAANIAHNKSADAAYYNPANMVFMEDTHHLEADLIYIGLDPVNYKGTVSGTQYDIDAESESFFIPSLNYVSKKLGDNNARIGVSVAVPGGLSKRWNDSPAKDKAEEFTLEVVEVNPTVAFEVSDTMGLAFGFRILNSSGIVKSSSSASRDMTGSSVDFGYNLAFAYKPTKELELGVTYRSKVDISVEGNAKLYIGNAKVYDGGSSVTIPLPAVWSFAMAYTLPSETTVEFVYERNLWSAYKSLDFDYVSPIPPILQPAFDGAIAKDWEDTNAYRLGITQELSNVTLMAGVVYDETPVPAKTVSFELPDSNSLSLSLGGRYHMSKTLDFGLSALYSMRESRTISASDANDNAIVGEFSNANVLIVSAGVGYKF